MPRRTACSAEPTVLLACLVVGVFGGLLTAHAGVLPSPWWAYGVGTVGALLTWVLQARWQVLLASSLAAAAWACVLGAPFGSGLEEQPVKGLARLTVRVGRTACGDECWAETFVLRCELLEGDACPEAGARISLTTPDELPAGGKVALLGRISSRFGFRNPTPAQTWPDARPVLRARAVPGASVRIDHVDALSQAIARARASIRETFHQSLREPHAGIARALLLGEGTAVPSELNDAIRNAGVSHILAVSGMHVTVLAGALVTLVRLLWLRSPLALYLEAGRAAAALGVLLAPLVTRLCGASPSAGRAGLTSMLMYGLWALGRRPHALSVSALAILLHAALDPVEALHPGFVLSVLATAALLTGVQGGAGLWQVARESGRAWLATAPFLALCFGSGSLVALLANVVLLPLGGLLIPAVVAHLCAAALGWSEPLGTRFLFETTSGAFLTASRLCASLDPGLQVPPLTPVQALASALLAAGLLGGRTVRVRLAVATLSLVAAALSEWWVRHPLGADELRITFLDVGQGDGALIETGRGQAALIDAGGALHGGPDPGAQAVLPVLRALRIRRLDLVVLSHPHPDHYGGLAAVLNAVEVGELWDTGQAAAEQEQGAVARMLEAARSRGIRVRGPDSLCGKQHALGPAQLHVLSPCPTFDPVRNVNDNSFVLRLAHGARSVLFTGDAEGDQEAWLLARHAQALRSDVLKVGHHGSRTSSSVAFVAAVAPRLGVISAGRGNSFGHPHAEVVERLQRAVPHMLRTDQVGGVQVSSDGRRLRVGAWARGVDLDL